jgi:biotin carboxylase
MFKRVLIANRGLIQANCVRAVKELGATAITVFEEGDRDSAGVRNADEAYELKLRDRRIRPYLDLEQIVELAESLKVDAVHPGYGFLSQNAKFARELERRGIQLIAPRVEGRFNLSNKYLVKEAAQRAGLPVLKGLRACAIHLREVHDELPRGFPRGVRFRRAPAGVPGPARRERPHHRLSRA